MANDQFLAIDVGAWSIKIGEFENAPDGLTMKQFGYGEYSSGMTDENRADLIVETLKKILNEKPYTAKKAFLSLSSQLAFTRFVKLPPIDENEERVKQIVEFEAKQHVPFEMNEVIWDYQLIGTGEELDVMFVVIKNEIVSQITGAVEECGLKVELVDVASSSCYNSARANRIGDDSCAMVLSIGSRCSNLIFADGDHFFSRNIPIAGHAISQQISKEFGIGIEEAEELKQRHGFVALGGAYEEPESEVAATISKIVRNVMTRLHGEVNRSINIYRSQQKGNKPVKMYLAGGSSIMAFTETFFEDKLRLEVEYMNPFQGIRLGGVLDRQALAEKAHLFSEVIGIGLRVSVCPVEISLIPEELKGQKDARAKKPFYYFAAIVAVLIPLVFLAKSKSQRKYYEGVIEKNDKAINIRNDYLLDLNKAEATVKKYLSKFEKLKDLDERKYRCVEVFSKIEQYAPPGMWITEVIPMNEEDLTASAAQASAGVEEEIPDEVGPQSGRPSRRNRRNTIRQKAQQNAALIQKAQGNQIIAFKLKGFFIKRKHNDEDQRRIVDILTDYLDSLKLKANAGKAPIFQEDDNKSKIISFESSNEVSNLNSFEIQVALYKPIGKK